MIIAVIYKTEAAAKLKPEEKFSFNGIRTHDLGDMRPVQRFTNWAIKPSGSWSRGEFVIYP